MQSEILFSETQKFKQWWLWVLLLTINAIFIFGWIQQIVFDKQFGDKPMGDVELVFATCMVLCISIFTLSVKLETRVKIDGIYVRFFPFFLTYRKYPWEDLEKATVRTYSPLAEYGGWGYRISFSGKGRAFNISGNKGLQLEFKNGKKLLIGTNKPDELAEVLKILVSETNFSIDFS